MSAGSERSRGDVEQGIIERATRDASFRQQLVSNPRAALESELGMTLPAGVQVQVLEESPSAYYLVLPQAESAGAELSDADLDAVAGGSGNSWNADTCWNGGCP